MPKKIAMIGAGSVVFCKTLISDILATPALQDSEFALMSPTETKLKRMEAFVGRMIKDNKFPGKVWATTDRRKAIADADFVVVMIQVGGFDAFGLESKLRNSSSQRRSSSAFVICRRVGGGMGRFCPKIEGKIAREIRSA